MTVKSVYVPAFSRRSKYVFLPSRDYSWRKKARQTPPCDAGRQVSHYQRSGRRFDTFSVHCQGRGPFELGRELIKLPRGSRLSAVWPKAAQRASSQRRQRLTRNGRWNLGPSTHEWGFGAYRGDPSTYGYGSATVIVVLSPRRANDDALDRQFFLKRSEKRNVRPSSIFGE